MGLCVRDSRTPWTEQRTRFVNRFSMHSTQKIHELVMASLQTGAHKLLDGNIMYGAISQIVT